MRRIARPRIIYLLCNRGDVVCLSLQARPLRTAPIPIGTGLLTNKLGAGTIAVPGHEQELSVADDGEIEWHKEQIGKNRAILEELEAGNTAGGDVFPETQSEIDRLKAQIAQSELIVAAYEKERPGTP
jgi:hypothetical protein